jgi:Secretion system C-terminal sorting domain
MNMRKQGVLAAMLVTSHGLFAQPTFEKIWNSNLSAKLNLIELPSHDLLIGLSNGPGVSRMNPQGYVVQSYYYLLDDLLGQQSIRMGSPNEVYFVTGLQKDSCSTFGPWTVPYTHPFIGRMDTMGNVLSARYYTLNNERCWALPSDLEIATDGDVLTWGGGGVFTEWNFYALRTDPFGDVVWARSFGNHGTFQFIKELPGGDLLAGINMDTAGVVVARMDPEGNFLWCKSYLRSSGMIQDCVIESDSSFLITGTTDTTAYSMFDPLPPDYHPKLFLLKLNGDGEIQWCKGYDSAPNLIYSRGVSQIVKTQDDKYVVLAALGVEGYNISATPFLMKVDQNGDTLWTRFTGRGGFAYEIADLLAYSDGGFIYDGVMYGDIPGVGNGGPFIHKTDSLGQHACFERRHPITISDLFPTDSSFTLTSTDGATMHELSFSDTTFTPITVVDGCTFTMGIDYTVHKRPKPRIRPNPTTGRFTVEFQDPLMAESYYSVYDAMGKLLYQRPLPTGATLEEVDLGRFGSGTYVIKFTEPEGTCYERVVVE